VPTTVEYVTKCIVPHNIQITNMTMTLWVTANHCKTCCCWWKWYIQFVEKARYLGVFVCGKTLQNIF